MWLICLVSALIVGFSECSCVIIHVHNCMDMDIYIMCVLSTSAPCLSIVSLCFLVSLVSSLLCMYLDISTLSPTLPSPLLSPLPSPLPLPLPSPLPFPLPFPLSLPPCSLPALPDWQTCCCSCLSLGTGQCMRSFARVTFSSRPL